MLITEFVTNPIVAAVFVATIICQLWKFIDFWARTGHPRMGYLVAAGGMPSSHATFVCALAISIGFAEGFTSTIFLLSLGFAIIVLRDAFGVRHDVDLLRATVNDIISKDKKLGLKQLLRISGHTPVQVVVGAIIGIVIPIALHFLY